VHEIKNTARRDSDQSSVRGQSDMCSLLYFDCTSLSRNRKKNVYTLQAECVDFVPWPRHKPQTTNRTRLNFKDMPKPRLPIMTDYDLSFMQLIRSCSKLQLSTLPGCNGRTLKLCEEFRAQRVSAYEFTGNPSIQSMVAVVTTILQLWRTRNRNEIASRHNTWVRVTTVEVIWSRV
jgi:hypothetical protein